MDNQVGNSSYTVMLCLKNRDRIDIHSQSIIVDKFNDLFTCISDFATKENERIEEPKVFTSISGNQISFTIDSNGRNSTHEYMLRNLGVIQLCFSKDKYDEYKKKCHATVRFRVRELLQTVYDIGVTEIKFSVGQKTYFEKDISDFLETKDDYKGAKMPIEVQKGMKYLEELLSEVMRIVDTAGKKNRFYENPKFIFRGITQFFPGEEINIKSINNIKGNNNKKISVDSELEYVKKDLIKSSLAVRLRDISARIVENKAYIRAHYVDALESMIRNAKNMYPNKYTAEMSDLDILADIQHYGGATCLVDFSKNILTSIWFACSTDPESNGFLYCYNVTEDMIYNDALTQVREEDEKKSIHDLLAQTNKETNVCSDVDTRFCLWEPSKKNNRIFRQDSVFLFGIEPFKVKEHAISIIGIKAEWKQKILAAMKSIFNISGSTVYSDYVGFATNANKMRPYRKMGESTYTRGYANMIQGNYWSAMKFLKLSEVDAYKEEWDSRKLLELHFSLGVCYKGLGKTEKTEKTEYYRENALLEYSQVIHLAKKIIKDKTIKGNRDYYQHKAMRSYNARISLMYDLERYEDAIEECKAVKKEIEKNDGLLNDYNSHQMQLTPNYCDYSVLELQVLELLSHSKTEKELKEKIEKYNWKKESVSTIEDETHKMDFWTLIKEYYNTIIAIIYLKNYTKENIITYINNWNKRAQGYFKCKETNDAGYIPWNFEDVKKKIDAISTNSIFFNQKKLLQDLTAGVISLRDTYEIYGWWSNETKNS